MTKPVEPSAPRLTVTLTVFQAKYIRHLLKTILEGTWSRDEQAKRLALLSAKRMFDRKLRTK